MKARILPLAALLFLPCIAADGCEDADRAESNTVNAQQEVYRRNQPVPTFQWSLERHLMIQLYQARNTTATTYSYVVNQYTGRISWSCTSLGFPIPATTQLTNPEQYAYQGATLPQAEPNGLFAPPSTNGTWVLCTGEGGLLEPVYVEEHVRTFTRPMEEHDGRLVPVGGQRSTITLNPQRGGTLSAH